MVSVILLVVVFSVMLFGVAWHVHQKQRYPAKLKPYIYALSLAVYCSSWTFFGAVGSAVNSGWQYATIYLGPVLVFWLGWPFLRRLITIGAKQKVTSIADYIGSRFGKSQQLSSLVTLVAVIAALPYIALQLKAVTIAWSTIAPEAAQATEGVRGVSSLLTTTVMALFAVMFGTSIVGGSNRNPGLVAAISLEAIIKLVAFLVVGGYALVLLLDIDITSQSSNTPLFNGDIPGLNFITATLLSASAIICLPRQFHLMVVENHSREDLRAARTWFPIYLILFTLLVVPIAIVGHQYIGDSSSPDTYILMLPLHFDHHGIAALGLIGGIAAATGMMLVSSVSLTIMVCNEIVIPLWLKSSITSLATEKFSVQLRWIRGLCIVVILFLGWLLEQQLSQRQGLASLGLVAFAATAQLLPAIVSSITWGRAHRNGVIVGSCVGMSFWAYCLLTPAIISPEHWLIVSGPFAIAWLSPVNLFGLGFLDPLTHGVLLSLASNCLLFVFVSLRAKFTALDLRQRDSFMQVRRYFQNKQEDIIATNIEVQQLRSLIEPLLGAVGTRQLWTAAEQRLQHQLLARDKAPRFLVEKVEESLTAVIGSASAQRAIALLDKQKPLQLEDFVSLVGGTSRQIHFSQNLLQTTFESIPQGISVVDENQRLVAWNQPYVDLFDYPHRLLYVGCPISNIYEFNAGRGFMGKESDAIHSIVEKRVELLRKGHAYQFERELPSNRVVDIQGTPLQDGGYVTTYTEITQYKQLVKDLKQSKATLEVRVKERTEDLQSANELLQEENTLRSVAEKKLQQAHASKTRFMQSASHDLLQPINAARLFLSTLKQENVTSKAGQSSAISQNTLKYIDESLESAESLISTLREIARLENGRMQPQLKTVDAGLLMQQLDHEFQLMAQSKGISLRTVIAEKQIETDAHLLRRVLQNLLSNAINYTHRGRVLFIARRKKQGLCFQIWDTGLGLNENEQQSIFEEFQRLGSKSQQDKGLGLGLSIAQRMAELMETDVQIRSRPGFGSCFSIQINLAKHQRPIVSEREQSTNNQCLKGLRVLCVDNDQAILDGISAVLKQHACEVLTAKDEAGLRQVVLGNKKPALLLLDYHLDDDTTGLELHQMIPDSWRQLPVVIVSADITEDVLLDVRNRGMSFLPKPVSASVLVKTVQELAKR